VDLKAAADAFVRQLALKAPPVGVSFVKAPPAGVPRVPRSGPAGCSYWKRAAEGQTFYTEAADHYNCPIGAHTHGVDLPPAQMQELTGVVGTMVQLGYIRSEEVAGIPRKPGGFQFAVYAPLSQAAQPPDVVLLRGNPRQMMLVTEAAGAAGISGNSAMMGRPTCAAIPQVLQTGQAVGSLACIGNRVYTELPDDEFYMALPGKSIAAVAVKLAGILNANRELEKYHKTRA
jgi:uncharacterized protein (DUF169 family)